MAEVNVIFCQKNTKKKNKIKKYFDFASKLGKLASKLKMNITKLGENA